jgi:hypothetical protein
MDVATRPSARAGVGTQVVAAILVIGFALVVLSNHGSSQVDTANPTSPLRSISALM